MERCVYCIGIKTNIEVLGQYVLSLHGRSVCCIIFALGRSAAFVMLFV
jgi:hypothetical protein